MINKALLFRYGICATVDDDGIGGWTKEENCQGNEGREADEATIKVYYVKKEEGRTTVQTIQTR
jgi:hypothetical protein